jgi:hypothetical protein
MMMFWHTPDRPLPRGGRDGHRRGMRSSPRPAGRGAVPAGTRGAGLAATIFDGVAGGSPPADVASSQSVVDGAAGNPVGGAGATTHGASFPSDDNNPHKDH